MVGGCQTAQTPIYRSNRWMTRDDIALLEAALARYAKVLIRDLPN